MELKRGERVVAESESTDRPPRSGTVTDVLGAGRYRIAWDDGHESICTPASGSIYRESQRHEGTVTSS
jgi:translation initiation factor IF-1